MGKQTMSQSNDADLFGNADLFDTNVNSAELYPNNRNYTVEFEPFAQAPLPSDEPLYPASSMESAIVWMEHTPDTLAYRHSYGAPSFDASEPSTLGQDEAIPPPSFTLSAPDLPLNAAPAQ